MTLTVDPNEPSVWTDPSWDEASPGTFAVVIGASRYDYLKGDDASYGLDQLFVSALTAFRFFRWLKDDYRFPEHPIVKCWLLLAPTAEEESVEPALAGTPRPTFEACSRAVGQWFESMRTLNSMHAEKSRALFFFSGHGLQVREDQHILLPCDYLEPPNRLINRALSTFNLYTGLRVLPLPEHCFFIDACRNDHPLLREVSLNGTNVLNEWPSYKTRSDLIAPIVYAAGPGSPAWQPKDPKTGVSVFGQALSEGLTAGPGIEPACEQGRCWVTFRLLEDYLDPRVGDLLLAEGVRTRQPVRILGPFGKTAVCEVRAPRIVERATRMYTIARDRLADTVMLRLPRDGWGRPAAEPPPPDGISIERVALPMDWRGSTDWQQLYDIFQNEFMTALFSKWRVYDLGARYWSTPEDANHPLSIREVTRTADRRLYRFEIQVERPGAHWLELTDPMRRERLACVLPSDAENLPRFTLGLSISTAGGLARIVDVDASPARTNKGLLGRAAAMWTKFRSKDIAKVATVGEQSLLQKAMLHKRASPLAATVASLLLLRAWRQDLLHDWGRNLAQWFPEIPDGSVIWAEQLLRPPHSVPESAIPSLLELETRGLPHTTDGLALATRQAGELLAFAFPEESARTVADRENYTAMSKLHSRLRYALALARGTGLCTTFLGSEEAVTPALLREPV